MGDIFKNQFAKNEQITRGNLTGLSSTGSRLFSEEKGPLGKFPTGKADHDKPLDVNSAFEELKDNKHVFARTPDGREIEIKSLEDLKNLNQNDSVAGMGAQARNYNAYAANYNTFTPGWWPKMGAENVSPDGSHLDAAGYAPFTPMMPQYGMPGGWFPFAA
jgi:hypothetical protein